MSFPQVRLRRLRRTETLRQMVRETRLEIGNLIYPLFVTYGKDIRQAIEAMPGIPRFSVDKLGEEVEEVTSLGIPAVLLFGLPEAKDEMGSGAYDPKGTRELYRLAHRL